MPITDLSIETILQIDATLITGILILLTIGNLKNPSGTSFQTSKAVAAVVIPFAISAILELFSTIVVEPTLHFRLISIIFMIVGFVYVAVIVMGLSTKIYFLVFYD